MIPVTYPSSVSTSKESQMVVYSLSSVAGLQRWTDYIPVKYQSTGSDVPNSFNTNGYIACDFITNLTGKQAWVDYIPVFVDNLATTAWQVSDTGFIPFNTLAGGGTYVSLDLNFVNTTALDSRITFSRGTNATLTDSNGRIAWAPHNLLTNSEDFEAAAWTKSNATVIANAAVAPDGTITADKLIPTLSATDARASQALTGTAGITYTLSVYAKAAEFNQTRVYADDGSSNIASVFYNLTTGTIISGPSTGGTWTGAATTSTDVGSGWWRITLTWTATGAAPTRYQVRCTSTGDGTSGIFIWGAQLNVGALQSYNSTTPKNLLGFTQEPENAAWTKSNSYVQQNLLLQSNDFLTSWTPTNITRTLNSITSPSGSVDGVKIEATAGAVTTLFQTATVLATSATASVYVKQGTGATVANSFNLRNATTSTTLVSGTLNYSTGVFTYSVGSTGVVVTDAGNGWWRIALSATSGITSGDSIRFFVGFLGSTETAGTYLYAYGAQLVQGSTAGDYTQTTSAAAPTRYLNWDGTLTGRKLVEDTVNAFHGVYTLSTLVAGTRYTQSVYAKAGERQWMMMAEGNNVTASAWFNLSTGVVGTVSGTGTPTATITNVGGGWYRCSLSYTPIANAGNTQARATTGDNVSTYTGDGTSGIYVSDFQLSNSASVDPYVYNPQAAAASAAYYGPRFDYNPTTLAANGLLIEEARTNLLTYSEQFDNAVWIKVGSTVTANATVAPDGATTADKLVEDTSTGVHVTAQNASLTSGVSYTFSAYVKAAERTRLWFERSNATLTAFTANVDFSTGTVVSSTGSVTVSVTPAGNGFYRVSLTVLAASTASGGVQVGLVSTGSTITYTGDGTSGIFIWGAQLEAGSFATSYIPTVASQVTRNADSASMLGDNFYTWYNPNQGTLGAEAIAYVGTTSNRYYELSDGTPGNLIQGFAGPSTIYTEWVYVGGIPQAQLSSSGVPTTLTKIAVAYKQNDFAASLNGAAPATDTSGSIPPINKLNIGSSYNGTANLNGTIRRIGYYNTRLPDSTLQAMTT